MMIPGPMRNERPKIDLISVGSDIGVPSITLPNFSSNFSRKAVSVHSIGCKAMIIFGLVGAMLVEVLQVVEMGKHLRVGDGERDGVTCGPV